MSGILFGMLQSKGQEAGGFDINEMILHHLADSKTLELPVFGEVHLPQFAPVHLGPITLDFSITKHVFWMMIAALLTLIFMLYTAHVAKREHSAGAARGPRNTKNTHKTVVLY